MTVEDHSGADRQSPNRSASQPDIPHLAAPVLTARQVLAAHYVRHCAHIVEIGGYRTPITGFLTHSPRSVLSIDPKTEPLEREELNGKPCHVRHIAQKFQQVSIDLEPYSYGLVILGYSLKPYGGFQPDTEKLFDLIDHAKRTVIDYMIDLERPEVQLPTLLGRGSLREVHRIDMQFHDVDIAGQPPANRRLLVFEPLGHKPEADLAEP